MTRREIQCIVKPEVTKSERNCFTPIRLFLGGESACVFFNKRSPKMLKENYRVDNQQSKRYKFFTHAHENSKTPISFSPFARITHESKPTDLIQKFCALSKSP